MAQSGRDRVGTTRLGRGGDSALGPAHDKDYARGQDCYDMPWVRTTRMHVRQRNSVATDLDSDKKKKRPRDLGHHNTDKHDLI